MTNFEYFVVHTDQAEKTEHVANQFNDLGSQGWELVCMDRRFYVFKRPTPEHVIAMQEAFEKNSKNYEAELRARQAGK